MLKPVELLGNETTETFERLVEMQEFVPFSIVNAGQLIARAVTRQSGGNIRQSPSAEEPTPPA